MLPSVLSNLLNDVDEHLAVVRCLCELSAPLDTAGAPYFSHLVTLMEICVEHVVAAEQAMLSLTALLHQYGMEPQRC